MLTTGSGREYERLLKESTEYFAKLTTNDVSKPFVMVHHNSNPKFHKVSWMVDAKTLQYETVLIPVHSCKEFVVLPKSVGRGKKSS